MNLRIRLICCFAALMLALVPSVLGQTASTGALTGTITDPSGAVVPNAVVTATNVATEQSRTATSGSNGAYRFALLPPGTYRVRFEAQGFRTVEIPSVTVVITETQTLNRKLEIGVASEEVTV